ncbi:hypothetical protein SDC9_153975 [bioreactor metagenome]|uniref:Uncharacterized protein n=1 Tax=bioreactor metagenome TaxID=1076179 RepID=A0A645EZV5_9ZZZZ
MTDNEDCAAGTVLFQLLFQTILLSCINPIKLFDFRQAQTVPKEAGRLFCAGSRAGPDCHPIVFFCFLIERRYQAVEIADPFFGQRPVHIIYARAACLRFRVPDQNNIHFPLTPIGRSAYALA